MVVKHDPHDCKPTILNAATGKVMPDDSPEMQRLMAAWQCLTEPEREAFHRVTCQNSRNPADLAIIRRLAQLIHEITTGAVH